MRSTAGLPVGHVAFLLTDVEGSTTLLKRLGDLYDRMIEDHHALIRASARDGVEVRVAGDGFIWAFTDAASALEASVEMQRSLLTHVWPQGSRVRVRMGLHVGDAKVVDGDYVSIALHQAVRINAAAHGGQILVSPAFHEAVAAALPEFTGFVSCGTYVVRDFDGPIELFEVRHPDLPIDLPPPRVASAAVHNLAPPRTTFVGRSFDLGEVAKLLDVAGLVTLVGPGGIGKTRLACEAGRAVAGRFEGGVWLVALQELEDPAILDSTFVRALGLAEDPQRPARDVLVDRLSGEPTLLIVDNCEHLLDAIAPAVEELLGACPGLSVLATSREPLELAAEHVFRVDPLPIPDDESADDPLTCPSVELFVQRARQAGSDFRPGIDGLSIIGTICRELDGIPLALELVAARAGASSLSELASALRATGSLDAARRGGDVRHRTMRATIAWSYELLPADARLVFRHLGVFRGGFTVASASEVIRSASGSDVDVAGAIHDFVARSLVEPEPDREPARFRLLEPIRVFAVDSLHPEELERSRDAHVAWAATLCEEGDAGLRGVDQRAWIERFDAEIDNIRGAFARAVEAGHGRFAAVIASGSQMFCLVRGYHREALDRCTQALSLQLDDDERAFVLNSRGHVRLPMGDFAGAEDDFTEAVRVLEPLPGADVLSPLTGLAQAAYLRADFAAARSRYADVIELSRRFGRTDTLAQSLTDSGNLAISMGDLAEGRQLVEEAAVLYRTAGGAPPLVTCLLLLAHVDRHAGDDVSARARLEEAMGLATDLGFETGRAGAELGLAWVDATNGELDRAAALARSACDRFVAIGDERSAAACESCLAEVAAEAGDLEACLGYHRSAAERALRIGAADLIQRVCVQLGRTLCASGVSVPGVRLVAAARRFSDDGLYPWEQAQNVRGLEEALASARADLGPRFDREWTDAYDGGLDAAMTLIRSLEP